MEGSFWALTVLLGPLILAVAIGYALLRRRRLTQSEAAASRRATRNLYQEEGKTGEGARR